MLTFTSDRVLAVGEAMIEMAVIGEDTYRRGFAGDTFNTAWHMAQIPNAAVGRRVCHARWYGHGL